MVLSCLELITNNLCTADTGNVRHLAGDLVSRNIM